jgi:phosphohistidine swiveling domain-containing protein
MPGPGNANAFTLGDSINIHMDIDYHSINTSTIITGSSMEQDTFDDLEKLETLITEMESMTDESV